MALHVIPTCLETLHLIREADILHQLAVAGFLVLLCGAVASPLLVDQAVVAAGHKRVRLLGAAGGVGGFGDVRKVRNPRDVVQQAARLGVGSIAVGVAVFLLNVPPQFPALPLLLDLRLNLWRTTKGDMRQAMVEKFVDDIILCG